MRESSKSRNYFKFILFIVFLSFLIASVSAEYSCYQESFNVTNQKGNDGPCTLDYSGVASNNPLAVFNDGNWSSFASVAGGSYVSFNWKIPANATGVKVQAKLNATTNLTYYISNTNSCWNVSDTVTYGWIRTLYNSGGSCINGGPGTDMFGVTDTNLYEEAMIWNISGTAHINWFNCNSTMAGNTYYTLNQSISADGTCMTIANSNITLDCQGNSINYQLGSVGNGILINSTINNTIIKNCNIQNSNVTKTTGNAIQVNANNYNTIITNNIINGTTSGIYLGNGAGSAVVNSLISNNIIFGAVNFVGITFGGANNTIINNTISNTVVGGNTNCIIKSTATSNLAGNQILNNTINEYATGNDRYAININGFSGSQLIQGNIIKSTGNSSGIFTGNTIGTNITGNIINTSAGYAINLVGNNQTIDCQGQTINCAIVGGGSTTCVQSSSFMNYTTIKNCKINMVNKSSGGSFQWAIRVISNNYNTIIDNNTIDGTQFGIVTGNGATASMYNINVTNNVIYGKSTMIGLSISGQNISIQNNNITTINAIAIQQSTATSNTNGMLIQHNILNCINGSNSCMTVSNHNLTIFNNNSVTINRCVLGIANIVNTTKTNNIINWFLDFNQNCVSPDNNNLELGNLTLSGDNGSFDLNGSVNYTIFVNNSNNITLSSINWSNDNLIYTNSFGQIIYFLNQNITGNLTFGNSIIIGNNSAYTNSQVTGLSDANVTLYNIPTFSQPVVMRDGIACLTNCSILNYSGGNITFNVTGWSNYTIVENNTSLPTIAFTSPTSSSGSSIVSPLIINVSTSGLLYYNIINLYYSNGSLLNTYSNTSDTENYIQISLPDGVYYYNSTSTNIFLNTNSTETRSVTIYTPTSSSGSSGGSTGWVSLSNNGSQIVILSNITNITLYSLQVSNSSWDYNIQSTINVRALNILGKPVELSSLDVTLLNGTALTKVVRKSTGVYDVQYLITNSSVKTIALQISAKQLVKEIDVINNPNYEKSTFLSITGSAISDMGDGVGTFFSDNIGIILLVFGGTILVVFIFVLFKI